MKIDAIMKQAFGESGLLNKKPAKTVKVEAPDYIVMAESYAYLMSDVARRRYQNLAVKHYVTMAVAKGEAEETIMAKVKAGVAKIPEAIRKLWDKLVSFVTELWKHVTDRYHRYKKVMNENISLYNKIKGKDLSNVNIGTIKITSKYIYGIDLEKVKANAKSIDKMVDSNGTDGKIIADLFRASDHTIFESEYNSLAWYDIKGKIGKKDSTTEYKSAKEYIDGIGKVSFFINVRITMDAKRAEIAFLKGYLERLKKVKKVLNSKSFDASKYTPEELQKMRSNLTALTTSINNVRKDGDKFIAGLIVEAGQHNKYLNKINKALGKEKPAEKKEEKAEKAEKTK